MTTNYILLELTNFDYVRKIKSAIFNHITSINTDLCLKYNMNWYCETFPHITLLGDVKNVSNNKVFRELKYSDNELFKKFKKKCQEGLYFPEIVIDTFDNENSRVLKINCENCNIREELEEIHTLLKDNIENEETYNVYQPHITITYLRPDVTDTEVESIIKDLNSLPIPKSFQINSVAISDSNRMIDRINLSSSFQNFGGF